MRTTNFSVDLLTGDSIRITGPGAVDFQAPELAKAGKGIGATTKQITLGKGMATGKMATGKMVVGNGAMQTGAGKGATTLAAGGGGAASTKGAAAATIWSGKGLSLGLGLGLGAWGPAILITAATAGGYYYWKRKRASMALWPF